MGSVFSFFFKQKSAYEVRMSDWSSDVCSSDLRREPRRKRARRHDMLGSDSPIAAIEIDEIARPDVDRSRTIADRAIVQQVEVDERSEEHTSELQSLMRISYAVFCLKKKKQRTNNII